jgi:hypothetical protein
MCPSKEDTKSIPLSCCYVRRSNAMVRIPLCCTCKQEVMPALRELDHADHHLDDLICQKLYTP